MRRHALTDAQWARIVPLLPSGAGRPSSRGTRNFLDAVTWAAKTGVSWRDLPERFGSWKTVYSRFRRWAIAGKWAQIFRQLSFTKDQIDALLLDSTYVRAHQDSSGGRGGQKKRSWSKPWWRHDEDPCGGRFSWKRKILGHLGKYSPRRSRCHPSAEIG